MSIRNYGLIDNIETLRDMIVRVRDGQPFGFDIETGYDGPDREKGAVHPETAKVVGISFTNSTEWARYVPLAHDDGTNVDNYQAAKLFWWLLSTGMGVAHNAGFELRHLSRWFMKHLADDPEYGAAVRASKGYFKVRSDTQVEAYLAAEFQRFGLKYLTKQLFDHEMTELFDLFPDLPKNKRKFLRFNTLSTTPEVVAYACEDSVWCLAIHQRYHPKVSQRLLFKVEHNIVERVVPAMEDHGVRYDWGTMRRTAEELRAFRTKFNAEIMARLSEMCGEPIAINLGSPPQIRKVLFDQLGLRTTVYTTTTRDLPPEQRKMSTGDIALTKLAKEHPVVKQILQWREMTKLLGTYLDKYENLYNYADDGYAHPNHISAFVVTGRFAVSDPPYQQSPKKYHFDLAEARTYHERHRDAHGKPDGKNWCACDAEEFIPPPGTCFTFNFRDCIIVPPEHYGLGFDLSQAELRAIAGEAQETALLKAFENGDDVHKLTASLMLGIPLEEVTKEQRDIGKTMNFALLYGMGVKSLADRLALPVEEAQSLMDKYFAGYANIATWSAKQIQHGKRHGYVTSRFGRTLPIWEYQSDKRWIYQKGDRACVNYPIQGAATGDYMKIAMVRATQAIADAGFSDRMHLVMNIHDALEFYVHRSISPQAAIGVLKDAVVFPVPGWPTMKADWHLFRNWGSPTEITIDDDGTLHADGQRLDELVPAVEVDEDGEEVYALPEVDPDALREAARPAAKPGRRVTLSLHEMPTEAGFDKFVAYVKARPGDNTLVLSTPEGPYDWPIRTSVDPDDLAAVSSLLGPVGLAWEEPAEVDPAAIVAGLSW